METEEGIVVEWRIENFSQWCGEVHGDCIKSPDFYSPRFYMELYPKGISGQGEHLVVRLCGVYCSYTGELSFHSSDGSLLCKQQVNKDGNKDVLELPPGPKFEDIHSRIREGEDFITVKLRKKNPSYYEKRMCTTINVFKISVKMNPRRIEEIKSNETIAVCYIIFSPDNYLDGMELNKCSKNEIVHFMIKPCTGYKYPFAVDMSVSLTRSDGTVDSCVKNEHVFRDKSPWTFPDPLQKKELIGRGISLFLCLKTRNWIQNPFCVNCDYRSISIELNNTLCYSEKAPFRDPVTSNKMVVLTKDSGSQTSLTFDMPDDSVLSKELMCLYQDQKYSDFQLKCDNVTFPVHKNILSARSPVLDRLLSSDMKEAASSEVDIGDLNPSTLGLFLTYLYTGVVEDLQDDRALKLYYAADKYQVPSLKKECSKFLCSNVSISNVCDILSLADRHQDDELTAASHDFILDNYNAVLKSQEWENFMGREPLLAVKTVTHLTKDSVVRKHGPQ